MNCLPWMALRWFGGRLAVPHGRPSGAIPTNSSSPSLVAVQPLAEDFGVDAPLRHAASRGAIARRGELGSQRDRRGRASIRRRAQTGQTLPLAEPADRHYGVIRSELERIGRPIGHNDLLIAAHARALDAALVTDNVREFDRVPGLTVERWH